MEDFYYFGSLSNGETKTQKLVEQLIDDTPHIVAVDTETISLKDRTAIGISVATSPSDAFYFPTHPTVSPALPVRILKDPSVIKVFHNAPFDLDVLDIMAQEIDEEFDSHNIRDTTVMAHLLMRDDSKLQWLMWEVGREAHETAEELMKRYSAKDMLGVPETESAKHCCLDSTGTLALYYKWRDEVDMEYLIGEMKLIPILLRMSKRGIAIDQEVRDELDKRLTMEVDFLRSVAEGQGFSPSSCQQVAYMLAKRGSFLPMTRSHKSLSTDASILELLNDPLAGLVLNFRKASKLLNTYVRPLLGEERCYTHFHLDAITGRITSTKRNLQNIPPGDMRNMFIPDVLFKGFDYSQLELRVIAYLSNDLDMNKVFDEGGDIHQETANFMGIDRRLAKNVNFAMSYGGTDQCIRETAKIRDVRRCAQLRADWFLKFRGAAEWMKNTQEYGKTHGYAETIFGRKIRLPMEESDDAIDRKAVNYPVQGSAAEIFKRAMIKCRHLPLALQIHDELLQDGTQEFPDGLEDIAPFRTPIDKKELTRWE